MKEAERAESKAVQWEQTCQGTAQSPITDGNTAAPVGGRGVFQSTLTVSHEALTAKLITASLINHPASNSLLCRTFWATLTISCVRVRDFPVQLAAFFVESLQDLPHFVVPTSTTQFQVLPVQLQRGACILYAVVGFPLDVKVCEPE